MDETTAFYLGLSIAVQIIPIMLRSLRERSSPARGALPAYQLLAGQDRRGARMRYCVVTVLP